MTDLTLTLARSGVCCPNCIGDLIPGDGLVVCDGCGSTYPVVDGLVCTDPHASYWANVDADRLRQLLEEAAAGEHWRDAVRRHIPQLLDHMSARYRADGRFLWPINRQSRVLDLGAMWGGLTFPIAEHVREVVALDKTRETLRLLALRAEQDGVENVYAVQGSAAKLPFPDDSFDQVIMNGVLEWVAFGTDLVLERHWDGRFPEDIERRGSPREAQLEALKEARRVLRPGGAVTVAIENRYALGYFCGAPDDHVNLPFVPVLPRRLADTLSRLAGKGSYRTYIYSEGQLSRLFREAGFEIVREFGSTPHYIRSRRVFPLEEARKHRGELELGGDTAVGTVTAALFEGLRAITPARLTRKVVPSFVFIGTERESADDSLVVHLLREAGVLGPAVKEPQVSLIANRHADDLPVAFSITDPSTGAGLFCKVARGPLPNGLGQEAQGLTWYARRPSSALQVPELLFHGRADGVELLATSLCEGSASTFRELQRATIATRVLGRLPAGLSLLRRWGHRRFRRRLRGGMPASIRALVELQATPGRGGARLRESAGDLARELRDAPSPGSREVANRLEEVISRLSDQSQETTVSRALVHGDFDFCNLLVSGSGVSIVDWEDAEEEGWPFLDLGNLVANPVLMHHRSTAADEPFREFCERTRLVQEVQQALAAYCAQSGLPAFLVPVLLVLASAQQNARRFPPHRNPNHYPLFGHRAFEDMVALGESLHAEAT